MARDDQHFGIPLMTRRVGAVERESAAELDAGWLPLARTLEDQA
jgi:hypothetical protein